MSSYANPNSLVSTDWVEKNANDDKVVVVEVDVDTKVYDEGHIPGAVAWNWKTEACDSKPYASRAALLRMVRTRS